MMSEALVDTQPVASESGTNGTSMGSDNFHPRGTKRKEPPTGASLGSSRITNMRACDRCRNKKTRCNRIENGNSSMCTGCQASSVQCTFHIPITASRRKRVMKDMDGGAIANTSTSLSLSPSPNPEPVGGDEDGGASPPRLLHFSMLTASSTPTRRKPLVTCEGQSSISYILHSTPTLPLACLEKYDSTYGLDMECDTLGNGCIRASYLGTVIKPTGIPPLLQNAQSWQNTLESLVKTYFLQIAPLFPIITLQELFAVAPPPPLLLHSICAVAACRQGSQECIALFGSLASGVDEMLKRDDVLSDVCLTNVQVLLILSLVDDVRTTSSSVHPSNVGRARLGAALRMAMDLGLNSSTVPGSISQRIWTTAMVIDQWFAAKMGLSPLAHNPGDCLRLRPKDTEHNGRHSPPTFLSALGQLSGYLRAVLIQIYGFEGIRAVEDPHLEEIRDGLETWNDQLPPDLKFHGLDSSEQAGILYLLYTAIMILLYRCFMRHSFIVPNRIEFNLDIPVWMKLRAAADDALRWVKAHPNVLDAPFMVSYAIILCALIQYHTWARRKEVEGITALQQLQKAIDVWSQALPEDFLSLKRAEYAVIQVFLDAVEKVHQPGYSSFESKRGLNPTVGVQNRLPTSTVGFALLSDGTSSSGGILVITAEKAKEIKDLPPGTVIIGTQGEGLGAVVQIVGQPSSTAELEALLAPQHQMLHPYSVDSAMFSDLLSSFSFPQDMQMQIVGGSQEQPEISGFF